MTAVLPAETEAPALTARLADWLVSEGTSSGEAARDLAERIITAAGESQVLRWLEDEGGLLVLRQSALGIAQLAVLGDGGHAAETYWHGHDRGSLNGARK